eukprot:99009-Rhodomonas_salina.2
MFEKDAVTSDACQPQTLCQNERWTADRKGGRLPSQCRGQRPERWPRDRSASSGPHRLRGERRRERLRQKTMWRTWMGPCVPRRLWRLQERERIEHVEQGRVCVLAPVFARKRERAEDWRGTEAQQEERE